MSHDSLKTFTFDEASEMIGVNHSVLVIYVEREWISPVQADRLDQEDIARVQLILELQDDLGANDESVPVILHLIDQLYYLRHQLKRLQGS